MLQEWQKVEPTTRPSRRSYVESKLRLIVDTSVHLFVVGIYFYLNISIYVQPVYIMVSHLWTSDSFKQIKMKPIQAHSAAPLTNGQSNLELSCKSSRCNPHSNLGQRKKWDRKRSIAEHCFSFSTGLKQKPLNIYIIYVDLKWRWHTCEEFNGILECCTWNYMESVCFWIAKLALLLTDFIEPPNFSRNCFLACQFPSYCTWWCAANQRNNTANLSCFNMFQIQI